MVEHTLAVRHVHDAVLEAHDAAGRDLELKMRNRAAGVHVGHDAARVTKDLDDLARILIGALDDSLLHRLHLVAIGILLKQHAGTTNLELEALAAHGLHQNGKMQNAAAGNLDAGLIGQLLNLHGHVVLALVKQALLELTTTDDVAVATNERRGRRLKNDGEGRGVDLDRIELNGILGVSVDVTDIGGVDTHDSGDVARAHFLALGATQIVEGEQLLDLRRPALAVVLDHKDIIAVMDGAGVYAADAYASDKVRVIDSHALHGKRTVHVDLGSGHVVDNHVEQRIHVHVVVIGVKTSKAIHSARIDHVLHGEFELLIGGTQICHEVEAVVICLLGIGAGAVDLIDDDHDGKTGIDGVAKHEPSLGHGALKSIDQQQGAVGHAQDALDLAAEVGMARSIENVDLHALVLDRDVLRQDGDAALALLIVGVQHALLNLLVGTEGIRCTQQFVDQRGLAVVNVSDDRDVPQVLYTHTVPLRLSTT